ncbi:MAG: bactofilin family protein [Candidatus Acidiferrales bacterium]
MWGTKKPEAPSKPAAIPEKPKFNPAPAVQPPVSEAKKMSPIDNPYPNPNYSNPSAGSSGASARLGPSLHVKGEITGNEDLHVDGSVEGLIQLEDRKLVVGASAKVTADVIAREVVVYGNVKGNLRARDRIEIKKDGSVVGDLTTARIMIEDGAYFKGSIEIDKAGEAETDVEKPAFSRTLSRASD